MLRTLLQIERSFYADRQEEAPLLEEREVFLKHLLQQGTSLAAARSVAWQLLNVIRLLRLTQLRDVWVDEIERVGHLRSRNLLLRSCLPDVSRVLLPDVHCRLGLIGSRACAAPGRPRRPVPLIRMNGSKPGVHR